MPLLSSAATQSTIVSDTDSRTCPDTHSRLPSKLSDIILVSLSGHIVVSLSDIILDSVSDISWNTHQLKNLAEELPKNRRLSRRLDEAERRLKAKGKLGAKF